MKLGCEKRCSVVLGIASAATLILAVVATAVISDDRHVDAREEKKVFDQKKADDVSRDSSQESTEQVMTICLMPLECS
jgi:hypothetical protein